MLEEAEKRDHRRLGRELDLFHIQEEAVGSVAAAFWLFTGVCILSFFFGWLVMPETKGRTLEDIGESWNAGADRRLRDGSR